MKPKKKAVFAAPPEKLKLSINTPRLSAQLAAVNEIKRHAQIALKRAGRLATMPTASRKLFNRVWSGKASPRACIKAFCQECVGFERVAITECTCGRTKRSRLPPPATERRAMNKSRLLALSILIAVFSRFANLLGQPVPLVNLVFVSVVMGASLLLANWRK